MSKCEKKCSDCIHCGLCLNIDRLTLFDKNQPAHCKAFKDKSLFVELPCKVGNEAFFKVDFADIISKGTVISIIYEQNNIWVYCRYDNGLTYHHPIDDIGKTLFFTKEEAERGLERNAKNN